MQLLWHSAYMVLFSITASLPKGNVTALAALAAGIRLESILFLPAIAFNMTASILVGHYLGQRNEKRAKKIGLKIWSWGVSLISFLGLILWLFTPCLANLISSNPAVRYEIVNYLHYNILAIPFTGTSLILGGVFIGAGATKLNLSAIGGTVWLFRLPLAFLLGHIILKNATGVWSAMLISQFVQANLMFMLFLYNNWTKYSMLAGKSPKKDLGVQNAAQLSSHLYGKTGRL
jgi:Na+-driven multidrug efflux pump